MTEINTTKHVKIIISGKVQGVFFRASVKQWAHTYGISGSVRNNPDGTVTIVAEGKKDNLAVFVEQCQKGPAGASVESIEIKESATENHTGFQIL